MSSKPEMEEEITLRQGMIRRASQIVITLLIQASLLFMSAGTWRWFWAWIYLAIYLVMIFVNAIILLRLRPQTIAERSQTEGQKGWDRVVGGIWAILYFIIILVVAGLDQRYGWSGMLPIAWHLVGTGAFVLGGILFSWAMISNAHFSTVVRVRSDHGHQVCDTGPYRVVRHPGYVGGILQSLATPLLLGSYWSLIPGGIAAVLMCIRTVLEDRTLQDELAGYRDYAQRVPYRLLPFVW